MFLRLAALFIKIQMNIITGLLAVIKQWGTVACRLASATATFNFPISFSNTCFVALATPTGHPSDGVGTYAISSRSTSRLTIYGDYSDGTADSNALIIAIGG